MNEKTRRSNSALLLKDALKMIVVLFLCTLAAFALDSFGIRELNIILAYLIGILIITIETRGYLWGMLACLASILLFNYLFTEPRQTFNVNDPNYILSFFLFLVVSFITSTLMSKLQQHAKIAEYNEEHTKLLYDISLGYLNTSGTENILTYAVDTLTQIQSHPVVIYHAKSLNELDTPRCKRESISGDLLFENDTIPKWCLSNLVPCGSGTSFFSDSKWWYTPVKSSSRIVAVAGFYCGDAPISEEEQVFISTCVSQLALALERESLTERQG